jgi:hypothetical protein
VFTGRSIEPLRIALPLKTVIPRREKAWQREISRRLRDAWM